MPPALKTELVRLRKDARGSLTQADVTAYLARHGLRVSESTVGDFERGKYLPSDKRFVRLYAAAIGQSQAAILKAWKATKGTRKRSG